MKAWNLDDKVLSASNEQTNGQGSDDGGDKDIPLGMAAPARVDLDAKSAERGLTKLVLSIVELIRQLLEAQALRRVESGQLDDTEIERLGETLLRLEQRMRELKTTFGLSDADLRLDLGPLTDLQDVARPGAGPS